MKIFKTEQTSCRLFGFDPLFSVATFCQITLRGENCLHKQHVPGKHNPRPWQTIIIHFSSGNGQSVPSRSDLVTMATRDVTAALSVCSGSLTLTSDLCLTSAALWGQQLGHAGSDAVQRDGGGEWGVYM